jgi:hypothetical protein
VDEEKPARPASGRGGRAGVAAGNSAVATPPAPERDPAADLAPEDLVLKEDPKPRQKKARPRNKRHGRSR